MRYVQKPNCPPRKQREVRRVAKTRAACQTRNAKRPRACAAGVSILPVMPPALQRNKYVGAAIGVRVVGKKETLEPK
jgi:hypothetical protein